MECAIPSTMLRQDELAFLKAISTFQMSPALLKELRMIMAQKKKRPSVLAGRRSTTTGSGSSASQQLAGKRKASELASSGNSMEPANSRPAPGVESLPLPATPAVRANKLPLAAGNPIHPGWGPGVLSGFVAPSQTSGTVKPIHMCSDSSESGVSMETSERRMSKDMYGL